MPTDTRIIFTQQNLAASGTGKTLVGKKSFIAPTYFKATIIRSAAVSAIALFGLINVLSFVGKQSYRERKYKGTENQINAFNSAKRKPDIVLLGSSLVRTPLYICNFQHGHGSLYEDYCWDDTLNDLVAPNRKHSVFNFAIDGSMISDAFLVQRKFLNGQNSPKWIVYGIAPRDLIDNFVSKETRTPIFDRLFSLKDILFSDTPFKITLSEKLDLALEKLCWLYSSRSNVQRHLTKTAQRAVQGESFQNQNKNVTDMSFFRKESSSKNLRSYQKRYRDFSKDKFARQSLFLKELCKQSIKNGTNVLLVNMPLTNKITNLISQEAYSAYNRSLTEATKLPGVKLLDLQQGKQFSGYLFGDLVHLNGRGGYFLDLLIAQKLSKENKLKHPASFEAKILREINHFSQDNSSGAIDGLSSWWLAKSYFAETTPPEVIVLGDSQLWTVLGADAYVYRTPIDIVSHHRSKVLEHDLYALTKKKCRVFMGITPKALISDHSAICHALFSEERKPKVVALTLSPLNFIDANVPSAAGTESSTFFAKYSNPLSLQKSLNNIRTNKYGSPKRYNYDSQFKAAFGLGEPFERLALGENIICGLENYPFEDNSAEHRSRYADALSPKLYNQFNHLENLLKWLNTKHIKVVIFSNPISESNRALLPETFWKYYDSKMAGLCAQTGADYIDAARTVQPFNQDELFDDLHLNLRGGLRWSRSLAVYISNKLKPGSLQKLFEMDKYLK